MSGSSAFCLSLQPCLILWSRGLGARDHREICSQVGQDYVESKHAHAILTLLMGCGMWMGKWQTKVLKTLFKRSDKRYNHAPGYVGD